VDTSTYTKSGLQIHSVATKRSRSGAITSLELKRRNSDPATKCGMLIRDQPSGEDVSAKVPDVLEWKGTATVTIAGHRFRKVARFSKEDRCVSCDKPMDAIMPQGYKCSDAVMPQGYKCSGKRKCLCLLWIMVHDISDPQSLKLSTSALVDVV